MADGSVKIDARIDNSNIRSDVERINRELGRMGSNMSSVARTIRDAFNSEINNLGGNVGSNVNDINDQLSNIGSNVGSNVANVNAQLREIGADMTTIGQVARRLFDDGFNPLDSDVRGEVTQVNEELIRIGANIQSIVSQLNSEYQAEIDRLSSITRTEVTEINNEINRIGSNMGNNSREITQSFGSDFARMNSDITRGYTQVSDAHMAMMNEMKAYQHQMKVGMSGDREAQIEAQYGYFQLMQSAGSYTGSVDDMIARINELGKAQKAANDQAINSNRMALMSIYQTIGTLNNASSTASRFQNNLTTMNNPLYNTSRLALTAVDSLDRLARSGSPQQLALEFLGANASVKQYNDFIRDLGIQMMALPVIFGLAAAAATKFYGALHGRAMEENTKYAEAFNNMLEKLAKAFEPMVQAFAAVMTPMYNFIAKLAEMVIQFNEAHPVLAKFIQGMMMLVPALMVILTPLALGIGYFAGLRAILFAVRPVLMPIITGLQMMTAPAWVLAAAIAGLVVGFTHLWKTSETFRNGVLGVIAVIKQWTASLVELGGKALTASMAGLKQLGANALVLGTNLGNAVLSSNAFKVAVAGIQTVVQSISTAFASAMIQINSFGLVLVNLGKYLWSVIAVGDVMNDWITHLPVGFQNAALLMGTAVEAIRTTIMSMVEAIRLALGGDTSQLGQIFMNLIPSIIAILVGGLPGLLITAARFLPTIVEGINSMFPMLLTTITTVIDTMVNLIVTYLPKFIEQGVAILTKVIEGILQVLPTIITTLVTVATTMINTLINTVGTLLPLILDVGLKILMTLIDAIVKNLPKIVDAAINIMNTLINAVVTLLPQIIEAGIKILMALIDGIVKILPKLVDTAIMLVNKIIEMIITNLPKILDAGVKILMAIVDGIIKMLPKIVDAAVKIITQLVNIIMQNLPKIIESGIKILMAIIKGIIQIMPQLAAAALKIIYEIAKTIIANLPQILAAGVQILWSLIKGIYSVLSSLWSAITDNVIGGIKKCFSNAGSMLLSAGKDIVRGLSNGISEMASDAINAAKRMAGKVKEAVVGFFKIKSPSRVMKEVGGYVTEGLAVGITDMTSDAVKAATKMADAVLSGFEALSNDIELGNVLGNDNFKDLNMGVSPDFKLPKVDDILNGSISMAPTSYERITGQSKEDKNARQEKQGQANEEKAPTYLVMDKKVVGEVISEDVDNANKRRTSRQAQFAPQVVPVF
ncbi:carbamoyl-phosphate synthase [Bacillus pseudomycoides]|uniref:carbamoyl-phosphate synthase n=1 Tax=Bacillus pseudomycoides TaxID=64104 RepID=UPI003D1B40F5